MTKIELLQMMTKGAKQFRADREFFDRNSHLHSIAITPPQDVVDTVLAGFINHIGVLQGLDYALHADELAEPCNANLN